MDLEDMWTSPEREGQVDTVTWSLTPGVSPRQMSNHARIPDTKPMGGRA
jgi:hypothetical protein